MDTALFVFGKIAFLVVDPVSLIVIASAAALVALAAGWRRTALALQGAVVAFLGAASVLPIGDWAISSLEDDWPARPETGAIAGIVVLGGGEDQDVMDRHGVLALNEAGERVVEGALLARAHPGVPLVLSGGRARMLDPGAAAAVGPLAAAVEALAGRAPLVEDRSRSTAENAARTAEMVGTDGAWVIVTSAFHMTRAVESFCAAGFEAVIPWPTDYMGRAPRARVNLIDGLRRLRIAARERLGLAYYRVRGDAVAGCAAGPVRQSPSR